MSAESRETLDQVDHRSQAPSLKIEDHELLEAVQEGNEEKVQEALKSGADVNAKQESHGETALHLAARFAHERIIRILLDAKADFNVRDDDGWTPLISACYGGEKQVLPVIELLLEKSKTLAKDTKNSRQDTSLTDTSNTNESATSQIPPQTRSYVNSVGKFGTTALLTACWRSTTAVVRALLNHHADVNAQDNDGTTPLTSAARNGDAKMVEDILSFQPDIYKVHNTGMSALHQAMVSNNDEDRDLIVDLLLRSGLSASRKNDEGYTPLHLASDGGHLGIVKKLLDQPEIDVNVQSDDGVTPLHLASQNGHLDVVELLLNYNEIKVNPRGLEGATALFLAAQNNHSEIVQKLLGQANIDGNAPSSVGLTPLHVACKLGSLEVVERLLNWPGVKPDIPDFSDRTPLIMAVEGNHSKVVQSLLGLPGINLGAADCLEQRTALHTASSNGSVEIVEMIINKTREHLNSQDGSGLTALHLACRNGYMDVARKLFSRGAKSRVGSDSTQSAWYWLIQYLCRIGELSKSEVHANSETHAEQEIHFEQEEGSELKSNPSVPTPEDINFFLEQADKEEKASATAWASTPNERKCLARIMRIEETELLDYELIRLAMSSDPWDLSEIVDRLEVDTSFRPQPTSALQWAAYHGHHDVVWWLLKNSRPGPEADRDKEVAKAIAESRRNLMIREEETLKGSNSTQNLYSDGNRSQQKERNFQFTVDMLTDPPIGEGARFQSYRKPITSRAPEGILKGHWATIVDFYDRDGRVDLLRRSESVYNVIYAQGKLNDEDAGPEAIMKKARTDLEKISVAAAEEKNYKKKDLRMRWIHLPANNMEWMEDLAKRIFTVKKVPPSEWFALNDLLQRSWHELPTDTATARYMKPVCLTESAQSLPPIIEKEELLRSGASFRPIVEKGRRTSTTQECKKTKGQESAVTQRKPEDSRAEDQATGNKSTDNSESIVDGVKSKETRTYERVALYMPYITFGLCHRKLPTLTKKDSGAPQNDFDTAGMDMSQREDNGPLASESGREDMETYCEVLSEERPALQRYNDLLHAYEGATIHGTRSLDRYFYNSPTDNDMDLRDQNQVFTRTFFGTQNGDGVPQDHQTWPYLAVDQLWLWVIDEETMITSSTHRKDDFFDPIVGRLFMHLRQTKLRRSGQPLPSSTKELSRLMVSSCIDFLHNLKWEDFSQRRQPQEPTTKDTVSSMSVQLLYEHRINLVATEETKLYREYKKMMDKRKRALQRNKGNSTIAPRYDNRILGPSFDASDLFDEVKDILDELNILKVLVTRQFDVWRDLVGYDSSSSNVRGPAYTIRGVQEMIEMAKRVQDSVTLGPHLHYITGTEIYQVKNMLSLEQNGINIDQAQESAQQGKILMVFTIVTVVFTPLSFLTSLFALNVTSFHHNSSGNVEYEPGWIFPVLFGSTGIVGLLMIYAFRDSFRGILIDSEKWRVYMGEEWKKIQEDRARRTESSGERGLRQSLQGSDSFV